MYNESVFQESEITVQIRVSERDTIRVLTDNRAVIFSNGYNCLFHWGRSLWLGLSSGHRERKDGFIMEKQEKNTASP